MILDINEECRNCTVVFDGRPEKIQVALKHLRVIGQSTNGGNGADAGARSQKVVAKQIAEEMRLVDLPAVQALGSELQELRNALQSAQKKLTSYEARDEKQAQEILQLTRELSSVKEEELQADLAVARAEAASQEMMAQVALHRQELAEEQRLTAFLRQQLEDVPQQEAKILKELELLRSEYQALAAKDSSQAWKSEAAACETLRAEMAAEQARHELELVQTAEGGLPEIHSSEVQNALFQAASTGYLAETLQQHQLQLTEALRCQLPDGTTVLHVAVAGAAPLAMLALLEEQQESEQLAVLNCRAGRLQRTPLQLHISSAKACGASVAQLLQLRADPALKDLEGSTAFLDCAALGKCQLAQTLLQFSGDLLPYELDAWHRTALHRAAQQGHVETVELLMQVSVPVDALDDDGRSALDYARAQQQEEVVRLLDPKAETFGEQHGQAFHHFVPAEGPSAFDHFNVYGANARTEAFGVATEGPSAADHFNVSKAQTPPPSSPWGVEALREKEKDLGGRRARPAAEEPQEPQSDIDQSTVKPGDGQEGSLRKRLGQRPTWSQQVSPGRRADECDDEASWGSWF